LDGAPDGTGNYVDIRVLSDEAVTLAGAAYNCTAAIDFIGGEQVA
jgi:hypothetical protein